MPHVDALRALDIYRRAGQQVILWELFLAKIYTYRISEILEKQTSLGESSLVLIGVHWSTTIFSGREAIRVLWNMQRPWHQTRRNFYQDWTGFGFLFWRFNDPWILGLYPYFSHKSDAIDYWLVMKPPASFMQAMEEYAREAPRGSTFRKDQVHKISAEHFV